MKKRFFTLTLVILVLISCMPIGSFAAEIVETTLFAETFGDPDTVLPQDLATSTTTGYNGWYLENDVLESAKEQGTTITIEKETDSNNVLHLTRTATGTDYENLAALRNLPTIPTTDIVKLSWRMKYTTNTHYLMWRGTFSAVRDDYVALADTGGHKFIPAETTEQTAKLNTTLVWHTYELVIDYTNSSSTLYVDSVKIGDSSNNTIQLKTLDLLLPRHHWRSSGNVYIDDIIIKHQVVKASYKANTLYYTTDDDVYVSTAEPGGLLKEAYISRSENAQGGGTAIFAAYNAAGKLQAVKPVTFAAENFGEDYNMKLTVDMLLPENGDFAGGQVKVFFWNNLNDLTPLEESSHFNIPAEKTPTLYLLGDSVMATYKTQHFPRAGIGMMLDHYFTGLTISNQSVSGAGTDTMLGLESADFSTEYKWQAVQSAVSAGDYVYIPLGGNDCSDGIGTENYINNLDIIVSTLNKKGVNVIIGTFVMWHRFDDSGKFRADFDENGTFMGTDIFLNGGQDYLAAQYAYITAKKVADTPGFMSVDAAAKTAELIGEDATKTGSSVRYFMQDTVYNLATYTQDSRMAGSSFCEGINDDVHLTIYGADVFAQAIAKEIYALGVPLSDYVNVESLDKDIPYPHFDFTYPE